MTRIIVALTLYLLTCFVTLSRIASDHLYFKSPGVDIPGEQLFKKLFKQRRAEQLDAVKGLVSLGSYGKQYKMVNVVLDKVFSVIQNNRVLLESSGYAPGISSFPRDETILDALANILENTALFGDIVLHLPDISHEILSSNYEWQVLFHWSLNFANQTQLLDQQTMKLLELVKMELNTEQRSSDYVNPYRRPEDYVQNIEAKKPIKMKKVKKRGPRLSVGEF